MRSWSRVALHCLSVLVIFQLLRLLFWWQNQLQFPLDADSPLLGIWLEGLRYDLSTIALCNALPYLCYLAPLPMSFRVWQSRLAILLTSVVNSLALGLNLGDIEYYKFTGKRLTRDSLAIAQDIEEQAGSIFSYYWHYSLILVLLCVLSYWLARKFFAVTQRVKGEAVWQRTLSSVLTLALIILCARGGLQLKPLIPAQAMALGRPGTLALNSAFTLLRSSGKSSLTKVKFFTEADLKEQLPKPLPPAPYAAGVRPKNVVLVILESFAKEYVEASPGRPSYAPFLNSLLQKGSSFPLAFANGRRSIDALPAILASIPAWMDASFITSPYQTNHVLGFAEVLNQGGWKTSFYHGGKNGTMFFDIMARQFGFQRYLGASEYPHAADSDGQWGIFDEPFLQWVLKDLDKQEGPFIGTVFTLTSHHPYRIPPAYEGRFPKGTLEIHESIAYADYALQRFYEEAQKKPWFPDTLFIFTADHTSKSDNPLYENASGHFAVPLLFIQNDRPLPLLGLESPAQHTDIGPTVLDILGIEPRAHSPFGTSLLRKPSRPGVVLLEGGTYHLITPSEVWQWAPELRAQRFAWKQNPALQSPLPLPDAYELTPEMLFLKAQLQAFNNGMVDDHLIW